MATKKDIQSYLKKMTGEGLEIKKHNETLYVKFDFLPFPLREYIHTRKNYDQSKMINLERDCACGTAYFLEEKHFFDMLSKLDIKTLENN